MQVSQIDDLDVLNAKKEQIEKEKEDLMASIPSGHTTKQDLLQAVKEKEEQSETKSLSKSEKRQVLKEIDSLKKAIPLVVKLEECERELLRIA